MAAPRRGSPLLAVALIATLTACGGPQQPASWDDVVGGMLGNGYGARAGGAFGLDRVRVVEAGPGDGALEVRFPRGSASQEVHREAAAPEGGAQFYALRRAGPVETATLRYRVRFPKGFEFVKGGKLPGLYGGTATAGGRTPSGKDGFSTRYMWRADGKAEVYAYLPGSVEVGTSLGRGSWTWPTGRWVETEQEVVLNTPGRADGRLTVRIDGQQVLQREDLLFRDVQEVRIDGLFFSTFFGGGDTSWATPKDQSVMFADFDVLTG